MSSMASEVHEPGAGTEHSGAIQVEQRVRLAPMWARILLTLVVLSAVVWFFLIPQFGDAEASFVALKDLSPWLVLASLMLQVVSLLSFSALTLTILGRGRLSYRTLLRIDLSDLAVNHTLPGGGTTAAAVRFQLFVSEGVPAADAITAATMEMSISNLALILLFAVGLGLSLTQLPGDASNYGLAIGTVEILLFVMAVIVWLLVRRTEKSVAFAAKLGQYLPFVGAERAAQVVVSLSTDLIALGHDPRRLVQAALFATGNWLFDAGSLWMMLAAFGHPINVGPLLAVYGLASIIAMLPLTPGGIGLVEGVTVPALLGFGVPHSAALLGVIGWRVFEFWLPIPVGGAAYASLRIARSRREHRPGSAAGAERRTR